ncbi:MAG: RNA polymerase sigma factor [Lewinellaceae bacterium]|nr:RNA polymerase sigma factor [Lewinellaceae bacterium]
MSDEKQFIQSLKKGEAAAFQRLVEESQERVLNTCLGFVPNLQDAEDLTQEVFLEAFRSAQGFREESSVQTWLYRIAINKSLELLRHRKRKKRWAFLTSLDAVKDADGSQHFQHPGVLLENEERAELFFNHLARLPENQRTAFVLHKVEGLSHREIGEVMQRNVSAVESLIHRAKKQLRESLKTWYEQNLI